MHFWWRCVYLQPMCPSRVSACSSSSMKGRAVVYRSPTDHYLCIYPATRYQSFFPQTTILRILSSCHFIFSANSRSCHFLLLCSQLSCNCIPSCKLPHLTSSSMKNMASTAPPTLQLLSCVTSEVLLPFCISISSYHCLLECSSTSLSYLETWLRIRQWSGCALDIWRAAAFP